jgi:hypothetical protein
VRLFWATSGYLTNKSEKDTKLRTVPSLPKIDKGEPMFDQVGNPVNWQEYTYTAKFEKGRCKHHFIPTGAKLVHVNSYGDRKMNGWEFYYKPRESEVPTACNGATQGYLFPGECIGCLDATKLRKYGLAKQHMVAEDALFSISFSCLCARLRNLQSLKMVDNLITRA